MFSRLSCLFQLIHCSLKCFSNRARERQLCIFIATKEIIYMKKHGRCFIVSAGNQYVCRNIFYEHFEIEVEKLSIPANFNYSLLIKMFFLQSKCAHS